MWKICELQSTEYVFSLIFYIRNYGSYACCTLSYSTLMKQIFSAKTDRVELNFWKEPDGSRDQQLSTKLG
jgi:hypothetical protein